MNLTPLIALASCLILGSAVMAQDVQEQPIIEVSAKLYAAGKKASDMKVSVYQDNKQTVAITTRKNSFDLELELNHAYTIKVSKSGFETYTLFLDGNVSSNIDADQKLRMEIDLQPAGPVVNPYYSDFPNAIMSWDGRTEMFAERSHYSAHILEKKQPLQAMSED